MDVESVRDWLVIIAGILWILLTLVVAVFFAALWWLTRMGLNASDKAVNEKVRPALEKVHARAAVLQDRTSRLPGNVPTPEGEARLVPRRRRLALPFRRRRRRVLPFLR
jgi:hypothetical protein